MENILKYEKLVSKIASKYSYYSSFEDLKQVGMIGLLQALENYKPNQNTKFSTYAVFWIKGKILEYLRKDKNIKISKEILTRSKEIEASSEILRQKLSREPSISEIALFIEKDEASVVEAIMAKEIVLSSDYNLNSDEDGKEINLYDAVPYYEKAYKEDILDLKVALEELPQEERQIIDLRYYQDLTQLEVSELLGTNQVNVSRKESKILQKLNKNLVA